MAAHLELNYFPFSRLSLFTSSLQNGLQTFAPYLFTFRSRPAKLKQPRHMIPYDSFKGSEFSTADSTAGIPNYPLK